ncbi:hypothetical protein ACVDG5_013190 [Mesorhizobium sp. ORM6]
MARDASILEAGAAPHPPLGHLLPVNGEKASCGALGGLLATLTIGEILDEANFSIFLLQIKNIHDK